MIWCVGSQGEEGSLDLPFIKIELIPSHPLVSLWQQRGDDRGRKGDTKRQTQLEDAARDALPAHPHFSSDEISGASSEQREKRHAEKKFTSRGFLQFVITCLHLLSAMQPYMASDMTQNVYDAITMRHALAR